MARALRWAQGSGPMPIEILAGRLIDRFGVESVFGRPLIQPERAGILAAEAVVRFYHSYKKYGVDWTLSHPDEARLLFRLMKDKKEL